MIPFIRNTQNRYVHSDGMQISGYQGLRGGEKPLNE